MRRWLHGAANNLLFELVEVDWRILHDHALVAGLINSGSRLLLLDAALSVECSRRSLFILHISVAGVVLMLVELLKNLI